MKLEIKVFGNLEQVVISALPKAFVGRIYRHCWGKNNTPYFANNCFKGILYFDERLAAKYADDVGYSYRNWQTEDDFHHWTAMVYESGLEITATIDGGESFVINASGPKIERRIVDRDAVMAKIKDDEVAVLMGAVDKGAMLFTLNEFTGDFDADKLTLVLESAEEFYFDDVLIIGMQYDGVQLGMEMGESRGKNMIAPILLSKEGRELDMYDFS